MIDSDADPLVSVIIPAYNRGSLLAHAIESALAQTYSCIEIIVVNDGSTDSVTRETAEHYKGRIVYIEQENTGVAAARNKGIAAARGKIIALLDSDDVWLPAKLAVEIEALRRHPDAGLVCSSYYLIDDAGNRIGMQLLPEGVWKPLPELLLNMTVSPCTVIFPREFVEEIGPFDPALNGADDWDWFLRLAARGYDFYRVSQPLAEYRRHEGNITRHTDLMVRSWLRMFDKFYSLPDVPQRARGARMQAFYNSHAHAVALYYGSGELDMARSHLRSAARYYPQEVARGRFLQSLIYSASPRPTQATAQAATDFVMRTLHDVPLQHSVRRRLDARARLILVMHAERGRRLNFIRGIVVTILSNPSLLIDAEIWAAVRQRLSKLIAGARGKSVARVLAEPTKNE